MATAWPNIEAPSSFKETDYQPQYESQSEAGYTRVRAKGTAVKTGFAIGWSMMTSADKATLKAFLKTYKGTALLFTHPDTAVIHTVVVIGDSVDYEWVSPGYWKVSMELREI